MCSTSCSSIDYFDEIIQGLPWFFSRYRPKLGPWDFGPFKNLISPIFGMCYTLERAGDIQVGDPVYAVSW